MTSASATPDGPPTTPAQGPPARVHLDAGGDSPVRAAARQAWLAAVDEGWADPRRLHHESRRARLLLDGARASLAADLGVPAPQLHLTASHTAALHLAVAGASQARRRVGPAVVVSAVERAAVHAAATWAAPEVRTVPVDRLGRVDVEALRTAAAAGDVRLLALQHANGEVGTLQPVEAAHEAARSAGVPLLVDAGASIGHVPVGPAFDLLAADPRDWGAPGGLGLLAVRAGVRVQADAPEDPDPWAPGGVPVPSVLAAAVALREALDEQAQEVARTRRLVAHLRSRVAREVPDVDVVGDPEGRLPHVVTFSCLYVDGEALLTELDRHGFAVGSGSACTSASTRPSHVLAAMGVLTHGNVRIALHRGVGDAEVDRFCDVLPGAVSRVRSALGVDGL